MNDFFERDYELAERLAEAERDAAVSRAVAGVTGVGSVLCIDCGEVIETARRAAAPWAVRCLHCQQEFEWRAA